MNKKVVITVSDGHHYHPSLKKEQTYTSVSFQASGYGAASPCDSEDEVQSAIASFKDNICKEGDIPVVVDNRVTLARFGGWE